MKRVLKICGGTWENASASKRELTVCRELDMEALVMAKGRPGDSFREDEVDGYKVYRFSTRPLGEARWLNPLNRALSLWIWGRKARNFQADIISGQNITGLLIGYLSNLGSRHKAKLVYDSREFEMGRAVDRSRAATWAVCHLERFLMKRCAFSIMINDSYADEVQRIHRLQDRPVVARNVPPRWELDSEETARVRREFLSALRLPEDAFLVMYHGAVLPSRGIEGMLRAAAMEPGTGAVVLGNALDANYAASLRVLVGELGIQDRVLFHPAVPIEALRNYVGAADVSATLTVGKKYRSYYLSLPNKFFEAIQSMTPQIASDYPEHRRLVQEYGVGLLVDPEKPEDVAAAIRRMRDDREFYAACKENLKRAKQELCWENEKTALKEAYRKLL